MSPRKSRPPRPHRRHGSAGEHDGAGRRIWLYGAHTALAAAANPMRRCQRLVAADANASRLAAAAAAAGVSRPEVEVLDRHRLDALLPPGSVHQGLAVLADPLPETDLETILAAPRPRSDRGVCIVVLDQVTDPRNVGAILRSSAAFGAGAVVVQERHAPEITPALAKSASGALEHVPMVRAVNLARALRRMQSAGLWCLGLDPSATDSLAAAVPSGDAALVIGAEGTGLRPLVRATCDRLAAIPIEAGIGSLNAATATAISLYELRRAAGAARPS